MEDIEIDLITPSIFDTANFLKRCRQMSLKVQDDIILFWSNWVREYKSYYPNTTYIQEAWIGYSSETNLFYLRFGFKHLPEYFRLDLSHKVVTNPAMVESSISIYLDELPQYFLISNYISQLLPKQDRPNFDFEELDRLSQERKTCVENLNKINAFKVKGLDTLRASVGIYNLC